MVEKWEKESLRSPLTQASLHLPTSFAARICCLKYQLELPAEEASLELSLAIFCIKIEANLNGKVKKSCWLKKSETFLGINFEQ